jgi:hypothetical protein
LFLSPAVGAEDRLPPSGFDRMKMELDILIRVLEVRSGMFLRIWHWLAMLAFQAQGHFWQGPGGSQRLEALH